jgi:hypothetical protein
MHLWEPPTTQNRQLPPCRKSRRNLYPTDYWNTAQALTNQRQQLKLEWLLVSARPTARGIKMRAPDILVRFTVALSTSEHLLYWRHEPAPLEIASFASIALTRQSPPRSARCTARCSAGQKEDRPFQGHCFCRQPASQLAAKSWDSSNLLLSGATAPWRLGNAQTCISCEVFSCESGWTLASLLMARQDDLSQFERARQMGHSISEVMRPFNIPQSMVSCVPRIPHGRHYHPLWTVQWPTTGA